MAVLIDPPSWPAHGRHWSHLVSDSSLAQLHAFARSIGVPERGFEGDHYDLPEERYAVAVAAGAIPVSGRELLRRLQSSGLRISKRRGERVLASRLVGGERVDLIRSALPPLAPARRVHLLAVRAGAVLVLDGAAGPALPAAELAAGGDAVGAGRALLHELLGAAGAPGGPAADDPVQVGFLRGSPLPGGTAGTPGGTPGGTTAWWSEPVLRWRAPGAPGWPATPSTRGHWLAAGPATADLPEGLGLLAGLEPA